MCGFAAYFGPDADAHASEVQSNAARVRHRGPDDSGVHRTPGAVLAHRRLSIVDLSGGRQPLLGEDGSVSLVCNGEIYNHAALRSELEAHHVFKTRSDSEVIVHGYEDARADCVSRLDGMFAFVVNGSSGFLAARDPLGIKPLYLARSLDGGYWFASELKSLPASATEIEALPPGALLTEDGQVHRWFFPTWSAPPKTPVSPDLPVLAEKLDVAVRKRMMSDVPVGVFLSGGLDSSVIAALVRPYVDDLHSFAVGVEGSSDLEAARRVAAHLQTHHHEYVYTAAEAASVLETVIAHLESYDPALIRSAVPCYFVSKLAAESVKVVLTGEGADEIFAGYGYLATLRDPMRLHAECARLLLGLHNMNLQRVDRMTMAHGLEGRVPFLDVDFLDWAMALAPQTKLGGDKRLLRQAFAAKLPPEIVSRPKEEFARGSGAEALLAHHGGSAVTDGELARATERFPIDTPSTKEAYLYRRLFEERYPGEARRRTNATWLGATPKEETTT